MKALLSELFDKHSEGYGVYDRENLIKDICKELQNLQLNQVGVISDLKHCKRCNGVGVYELKNRIIVQCGVCDGIGTKQCFDNL